MVSISIMPQFGGGFFFPSCFLMAYKIVIYLTINGALDIMNVKYLLDFVLVFADTIN